MIRAFRRGVRFQCTRWGACCSSLRSPVPLTSRDVERLSGHLRLSAQTFVNRHCLHLLDRVHVGERTVDIPSLALRVPPSGRCVFLADSSECAVHPAKPAACARAPFLEFVAESPEAVWKELVAACPGVGTGTFHDTRAVRRLLQHEAADDRTERRRLLASGGSLATLLGVRLPAPVVREHVVRRTAIVPVTHDTKGTV